MANNSATNLKEYKNFLNECKVTFTDIPVDESYSRYYQRKKEKLTDKIKEKYPKLVVPSDLLELEAEVAELSSSKGGIPEPTHISINKSLPKNGRSRRNRKRSRKSRRRN